MPGPCLPHYDLTRKGQDESRGPHHVSVKAARGADKSGQGQSSHYSLLVSTLLTSRHTLFTASSERCQYVPTGIRRHPVYRSTFKYNNKAVWERHQRAASSNWPVVETFLITSPGFHILFGSCSPYTIIIAWEMIHTNCLYVLYAQASSSLFRTPRPLIYPTLLTQLRSKISQALL